MPKSKVLTDHRGARFDDAFRRQAVRLIVEEQYTFAAAAQAVGVSEKTLRGWHRKFGPAPQPCGADATLRELQAENQRLRRELRRAELEREILKKATASVFLDIAARRSRCEACLDRRTSRLVSA